MVQRGGVPLSWTASGRLASWGDRAAFAWDALERPLEATLDGATRLLLFGGRVEADVQGNPLAMELGDVRVALTDGSRLYRHRDFRNNVKFTTDDAGQVVSHSAYHPYGVQEVHGATDDRVRFVGGTDLGELVMVGVRIFDPLASRFLSPDPIFQLVNDFAYALGNPVQFSDPDGTNPVVTIEIILAVVGLGAATYSIVTAAGASTLGLVVIGVGFGAAGLAFALAAAKHGHVHGQEGARIGPGTCSPAALSSTPSVSPWWIVAWLIALLGMGSRRRLRDPGGSRRG